jgi:ribonuclease HI
LLTNKEASTRIIKWAAKLPIYTLDFEWRSAIKSQVLADFVVDWTSPTHNPGEDIVIPLVVHCDGAWCDKGIGISAIVTSPTGVLIRYAARLNFVDDVPSTNNITEYEALLLLMRKMKALVQQTFIIKTDLLTVNSCIKVRLDLQVDKSSVVVKGPFFPQVWTQGIESVEQICNVRSNVISEKHFNLEKGFCI